MSQLKLQIGSVPTTPASGWITIYPKGDKKLYYKDDAGNESVLDISDRLILNGPGAPAPTTGQDGDYYIDNTNTLLYGPKTGGSWGSPVTMVGPQGIQGIQGLQGIQGIQGNPGNNGIDGNIWRNGNGVPSNGLGVNDDYYLDDVTSDYYKKIAGVYVLQGNLNSRNTNIDGGQANTVYGGTLPIDGGNSTSF